MAKLLPKIDRTIEGGVLRLESMLGDPVSMASAA